MTMRSMTTLTVVGSIICRRTVKSCDLPCGFQSKRRTNSAFRKSFNRRTLTLGAEVGSGGTYGSQHFGDGVDHNVESPLLLAVADGDGELQFLLALVGDCELVVVDARLPLSIVELERNRRYLENRGSRRVRPYSSVCARAGKVGVYPQLGCVSARPEEPAQHARLFARVACRPPNANHAMRMAE